ncbi:MAG TPA: hypothetical protein VN107_03500 [Microbacterium sp.]|nr:hypothetical protein [Microbacterium sp.]
MAGDLVGAPDGTTTKRRRGLPVWLTIALWYIAARAITTCLFLEASALSGPKSRTGAHPSLWHYLTTWDASWYRYTASHGYPTILPLTPDGHIAANSWAFMPVYPYLARYLGMPFHSWPVGGITISVVAGYLCALVLYRMWRMRLDASASMWAVVFFVSGPLGALFQIGYAESLGELWLVLILWCVMRRSYGWLYLLIPLFGFTRPGALPVALFLGLYGIWRLIRRREERLRAGEVVHIAILAVWATVVGFAWQVIAGLVTGDRNAYLETELAWRHHWAPNIPDAFAPFQGFLQGVAFWCTTHGVPVAAGYVTLAVLVVGAALLLLFEPHVRRLGVELRLWTASYLLYIVAVFFPQSSIFRLLFPTAPIWGAVAAPRSRVWRVGVLVVALVGQWLWIYNMYGLGDGIWRIP